MIYPGALLPITVGRPTSLALVQSLGENRTLAVISQRDPRIEEPGPDDLYEYGTGSLFCVTGPPKKIPVVQPPGDKIAIKEVVEMRWSFDERINDGF